MTIKAPDTYRQWQRVPPLNTAHNDHITKSGVRISLPCYIDITMTQRKEILNACRDLCQATTITSTPPSMSGISVQTTSNAQSEMESYIGMSLDVLRGVIFQRGGIEAGLLLRLQEVTGLELVTDKDFTAAFKARHDAVKKYRQDYPYMNNASQQESTT